MAAVERRPSRIPVLDLARGIGIFWMLMLHSAAFYNYLAPPRLGLAAPLPVEQNFCFAWTVFCPWGEQFFIALAMVNLAWGSDEAFRRRARGRLIKLATLAAACLFAQFLAWCEDLAWATTFSPVHAWVILLGLAVVARARWGLRGLMLGASVVALAGVGASFLSGGPLAYGNHLEGWVRGVVRFAWDYNARPEYFLTSSAAALVVTGLYQLKPATWVYGRALAAGFLLMVPWLLVGEFTWPSRTGLFSNEYAVAMSGVGQLFLGGLSALVVTACLEADRRGFRREIPLLNWLGRYSLEIYLLHAVLQSRVLFPLHAYLAWRLGFAVRLTDAVILASMGGTMLFVWAILRGWRAWSSAPGASRSA